MFKHLLYKVKIVPVSVTRSEPIPCRLNSDSSLWDRMVDAIAFNFSNPMRPVASAIGSDATRLRGK
jgi:hypothetical protein